MGSTSINRVFSTKVFNEIIKNGSSDVYDYVVQRYIVDPEKKTNARIISEIYAYLGSDNRNEYYYTNTLLNKLLVGIHSVTTTTALSQLRISRHIADFVMINGEGVVYEIKSNLDNLDRLNAQIKDYYKAFSKVAVLVSSAERVHAEKVIGELGKMGEAVGIYILSEKDTIFDKTLSRSPKDYNECLDHYCLLSMMRKKEYESILMDFFGELPSEKPVYYFTSCLRQFEKIPIMEAKAMVHKELKKRNRVEKKFFDRVPMEIKAIVYFGKMMDCYLEMENFLKQNYRGR